MTDPATNIVPFGKYKGQPPAALRRLIFPRKSILHRGPFVILRPWPSNIIGPPRLGDHRTPVERWVDFHFTWEGHFYG
jgi:hypothetical protein